MRKYSIGFPHNQAAGGPGSFQERFVRSIEKRGPRVVYPEDDQVPEVIIVVGGTRKLGWLLRCKRRGSKIIHRLDGINWRHAAVPASLPERSVNAARNWLMKTIRNRLADHVVYQSLFVKDWWHDRFGKAPCPESVIYNGVDLNVFKPVETRIESESPPVLLCVEGALQDDETTTEVLRKVASGLYNDNLIKETQVYGKVSKKAVEVLGAVPGLKLMGVRPRGKMPDVYSRDAVYLSLDTNPSCPNSVIEALASGIPVVGFDTGALAELILPDGGAVAPYGGDPWKLERPDLDALDQTVRSVIRNRGKYGASVRRMCERKFDLEHMVDSYRMIIEQVLD